MHHEILMALSGYPGNIFRVSNDDGTIEVSSIVVHNDPVPVMYDGHSYCLQVDSILPFVHPSEAALLNRLCKLGSHYNQLRKFISEQNTTTFSLPDTPTNPIRSSSM